MQERLRTGATAPMSVKKPRAAKQPSGRKTKQQKFEEMQQRLRAGGVGPNISAPTMTTTAAAREAAAAMDFADSPIPVKQRVFSDKLTSTGSASTDYYYLSPLPDGLGSDPHSAPTTTTTAAVATAPTMTTAVAAAGKRSIPLPAVEVLASPSPVHVKRKVGPRAIIISDDDDEPRPRVVTACPSSSVNANVIDLCSPVAAVVMAPLAASRPAVAAVATTTTLSLAVSPGAVAAFNRRSVLMVASPGARGAAIEQVDWSADLDLEVVEDVGEDVTWARHAASAPVSPGAERSLPLAGEVDAGEVVPLSPGGEPAARVSADAEVEFQNAVAEAPVFEKEQVNHEDEIEPRPRDNRRKSMKARQSLGPQVHGYQY